MFISIKLLNASVQVSFIVHRGASFTTGFCFDATGGRATY